MDETTTILVIEDEVTIATSVAKRLQAEGHRVKMAHDGLAGRGAASWCRWARSSA